MSLDNVNAISSLSMLDVTFNIAVDEAHRLLSIYRQPDDADTAISAAMAWIDLGHLINQRQVDWPRRGD